MTTTTISRHQIFNHFRIRRGLAFGLIIISALLAFEIFNYSTTDFALTDLLGDIKFVGIRWATILSIAFCGIDFAGIARLFTPEESPNGSAGIHNEIWYLFAAWLLAATMNAMLTWWGVSLAILGHDTLGNSVVNRDLLLRIVPIFVAIMVWLIRVLIIGSFSVAGERLFSQGYQGTPNRSRTNPRVSSKPSMAKSFTNPSQATRTTTNSRNSYSNPSHSNARFSTQAEGNYVRSEPTYHSVTMTAGSRNPDSYQRKNPEEQSTSQVRH
jgi:hypothetical protein